MVDICSAGCGSVVYEYTSQGEVLTPIGSQVSFTGSIPKVSLFSRFFLQVWKVQEKDRI